MRPALRTMATVAGLAGAFTGWVDSTRTLTIVEKDAQSWSPAAGRSGPAVDAMADSLLKTGHFTGPAKPEPEALADPAAQNAQQRVFPAIIATANLDGEIVVIIRMADGKVSSVSVGDEVDGTWIVESATLKNVVVSKDGKQTELSVFPEKSVDG